MNDSLTRHWKSDAEGLWRRMRDAEEMLYDNWVVHSDLELAQRGVRQMMLNCRVGDSNLAPLLQKEADNRFKNGVNSPVKLVLPDGSQQELEDKATVKSFDLSVPVSHHDYCGINDVIRRLTHAQYRGPKLMTMRPGDRYQAFHDRGGCFAKRAADKGVVVGGAISPMAFNVDEFNQIVKEDGDVYDPEKDSHDESVSLRYGFELTPELHKRLHRATFTEGLPHELVLLMQGVHADGKNLDDLDGGSFVKVKIPLMNAGDRDSVQASALRDMNRVVNRLSVNRMSSLPSVGGKLVPEHEAPCLFRVVVEEGDYVTRYPFGSYAFLSDVKGTNFFGKTPSMSVRMAGEMSDKHVPLGVKKNKELSQFADLMGLSDEMREGMERLASQGGSVYLEGFVFSGEVY